MLKVEWANQHIDNLERLCALFRQGNTHPTIFEDKIAFDPPPIPHEIVLSAGDAVHNLRASLDVCWSGLYRWKSIKSKKGKPTFPVSDSPKGLISMVRGTEIYSSLPVVEVLARDIAAHCDFRAGGNKPIAALNRLSNWEKHNLLLITAKRLKIGTITVDGKTTIKGLNLVTPAGHQAPTVVIHGRDFKQDGNAAIEIVFGDHDFIKLEPVVPTLRNISQACDKALKSFTTTFTG